MKVSNPPDIIKRLMTENLGLVYYTIKRFRLTAGAGFSHDDLESECLFGLMRAAQTFDTSLGLRFSSYAVVCIHNQIRSWKNKRRTNLLPPAFSGKAKVYQGEALGFMQHKPSRAPKVLDMVADRDHVEALLADLTQKEQNLLHMRFRQSMKLKEIADKVGVSEEKIRLDCEVVMFKVRLTARKLVEVA